MTLAKILAPLLTGDVGSWAGLPPVDATAFDAEYGAPLATDPAQLGYFPAERRRYQAPGGGELTLWIRDGAAVMVEAPVVPLAALLPLLGEPCAVLPQEFRIAEAYAHEYLYCERGLLLTVAVPLGATAPTAIARSRGISAIERASDLGPERYRALEDSIMWSGS